MDVSSLDPIGIFLAISGAKGEKLLFRYPFELTEKRKVPRGTNPYSLIITEDAQNRPSQAEADDANRKSHRSSSLIDELSIGASGTSSGRQRLKLFEDKILGNVFSVRNTMCNRKFECKIDDVTFVGHPQLVQTAHVVKKTPSSDKCQNEYAPPRTALSAVPSSSLHMFHILFALSGEQITQFVVDSYHRLAQKLAIAINHEESREGYLNKMVKQMIALLDMHQSIDSDSQKTDKTNPFVIVLEKNLLAKTLKQVFDEIVRRGTINVRINDWVQVSFCLLPKIHRNLELTDEAIREQITKMRPYHGLLLLESEQDIFADLPIDASPSLVRFIRIISPLSNFQLLAMEAGVTLSQVYAMAGHLIYWAKARLIFPVCENNVYALAPDASTKVISDTCDEFAQKFPGMNLIEILSDFSLPLPLRDMINPFTENMDTGKLTQIVIWCLKRNLLIQLHTYVYLIPNSVDNLRHLQMEGLNWLTMPHDVKKKVTAIPVAGNENHHNQDLAVFIKLLPYFRGNAHLEEMMFNANIKRSQLMTILDKFRDVLITVVHEDPSLPPALACTVGSHSLNARRHFSVSVSAHSIAQS
ncbi:GATOR complex protein NPRL3-like [Paramacrobiotus metropolitanus]|uniref:GATOR complex protein NPRL3-like n=1 Tax=Paramacrobiotus metropolitanus TaxID=2943436 RepID=UPI0024463847|nr:GATOR complex protein NPRL3-like [Paramacrobiotus metropolitanus]